MRREKKGAKETSDERHAEKRAARRDDCRGVHMISSVCSRKAQASYCIKF